MAIEIDPATGRPVETFDARPEARHTEIIREERPNPALWVLAIVAVVALAAVIFVFANNNRAADEQLVAARDAGRVEAMSATAAVQAQMAAESAAAASRTAMDSAARATDAAAANAASAADQAAESAASAADSAMDASADMVDETDPAFQPAPPVNP